MTFGEREISYPDLYKVDKLSLAAENSLSRWECKTGENSTIYLLILRKLVGLWSIVVGSLGVSGNLLTLLAIPYAAKRKRYGLERNYNSTTIFTLHLAFIDLCFCVICIPQYTLSYIAEQWPFGEFLCKWSGPIIFLITFVDWICLGFIALSRCLNMTKPKMWNNFCNKKTNVAVILIGMWALSALMTLPSFLEPGFSYGWNCEIGMCTTLYTTDPSFTKIMGLAYIVPSLLVIINYLVIWHHVKRSASYLRQQGSTNEIRFQNREMKMTWAILSVFLCYEVCATPISVLFLLELRGTSYWLFSVMIYLFQFMLNFFVYACQSEQYRKAYIDYLRHLKLSIIKCKCVEVTSDIPEWQRSTLTRSRRPKSSFHQSILPSSPLSNPTIETQRSSPAHDVIELRGLKRSPRNFGRSISVDTAI